MDSELVLDYGSAAQVCSLLSARNCDVRSNKISHTQKYMSLVFTCQNDMCQGMDLEMVEKFLEDFSKMGRALMSAEDFLPVNDVKLDVSHLEDLLKGE